jgi:hypothetical protein
MDFGLTPITIFTKNFYKNEVTSPKTYALRSRKRKLWETNEWALKQDHTYLVPIRKLLIPFPHPSDSPKGEDFNPLCDMGFPFRGQRGERRQFDNNSHFLRCTIYETKRNPI